MNTLNRLVKPLMRPILFAAFVTMFASAFVAGVPQTAYADSIQVPPVPDNLQVPEGSKLFFKGHAVGTQNYICLPNGASVRFVLFTPQATLFDEQDEQNATHFFSPNPSEGSTVRAAWQNSRDSSAVWGKAIASSSDPVFVEQGAIPWLKIEVVHAQNGPTGGDRLSGTTYIQRLNTSGGSAPSTGCTSTAEIGNQAFVPYEADYFFYRPMGR